MSDADAPPVAVLSLPVISYALLCEISGWGHPLERPSCSARTGRESGVQKREAPAVAGPGVSCRGVTPLLAVCGVAPSPAGFWAKPPSCTRGLVRILPTLESD